MRTPEQERYEAIFRAIGRRAQTGLLVCIVTALVVAFAFGLVSSLLAPAFPDDWPRWLVFTAFMIPFGVAVLIIPDLAQLLVMGGRTARAIEVVNVFGLGEAAEYLRATGGKVPVLANVDKARKWIRRGEGYGTRTRMRTLIWAGELGAAAESIAGMPVTSPTDAFHKALLREIVEYTATGSMDLSEARSSLERIAPSPERDLAVAALAFEEARLELDRGGDYLQRLADARAQIADLPKGASIRDRFLAGMPTSIVIFAVVAVVAWVGWFPR